MSHHLSFSAAHIQLSPAAQPATGEGYAYLDKRTTELTDDNKEQLTFGLNSSIGFRAF